MAVKPTLRERFDYWFDQRFSGGPKVIIAWLGLGTLVLVAVMTLVALLPGIHPEGLTLKEVF